jgi:LemA protein
MTTLIVIVAIVLVVVGFIWTTYNRLVGLRVQVGEAWSDIDVQLRRRYDLVPNLVETVKGYAAHEQGTFEKVVQARNAAMNATGSPKEQQAAENMLTGALKSLFALAEAYPDLKASQNFQQLQAQLTEVETNIQASRRYYNGVVRELNTKVVQFPSNIVAGQFKIEKAEFFEIEEPAARGPVKVDFSSKS